MTKLLLAIKLKNMLSSTYDVKLKNILINGDKRGCSGFIKSGESIVYVMTEASSFGYYARTAAHDKDYTGGRNHFVKTPEALVVLIDSLLKQVHVKF